jgi:formiminoglutamase
MADMEPSELHAWSGRVDAADGERGRRWHQVVRSVADADRAGLALLGFASDAGVRRNLGRPGAARGPQALRRMLSNLAWHGPGPDDLFDAGDVACAGDELESAQSDYADVLARLLARGHFPIGLGGGHEIAWASYQGLERSYGSEPQFERLGIVNFDAHLDLRRPDAPGRGTSGTPFLQIAEARAASGRAFRYLCVGASEAANTAALFDRAHELGTEIIRDVEADAADAESRLRRFIAGSSAVYLSFCLDVLPASVAPGVSAPSALGLSLNRALALLRTALSACREATGGPRLLMADVAELNPDFDPDGRTARTAARIVFELAAR